MLLSVLLATTLSLPTQPVDLRGGEKHEYILSLTRGEFVQLVVDQQGIDVVVTVHAPDGTRVAEIDSPNGANGPEPVPVAATVAGRYRIGIRSFDANAQPGKYAIRVEERLTPREYSKRLAEERARDEAVIAWMRARAVPLRSVEPGTRFDDLRPLEQLFAGVRVIGLGEATHGSHEIFALKHRLIEFLVARMGFTLVAMEGSVVVTETLNEYVAGRLDRDIALAALKPGGWITDTQELVALLDWMRTHNASVPESRRVQLAGLDPQVNAAAIDFLRTLVPAAFQPLLEGMRAQDLNSIQFARTEVSQEMLHGLRRLLAYLVANEGDLVRRTSAAEYLRAVHSARLLLQFGEFNSSIPQGASLPPGEGGTRDQYMADHLLRALQSMPPETRAVVWAHNSHVAARQTGSFPPMGGFLRGAFGAQYYALATTFDRGAFQAQVPRVTPPEVREFTVPAAEKGSVDWFLARATDGVAIVDLRRDPPSDERITRWLQTPHPMHWVGAIFSADSWPWQPFIPARDFDGLAMIDSTTRARPR